MPFLINDANLPATLTAQPMTDEEFSAFCAEHPDLNFEMTAEAELIIMPPTGLLSGASNSDVDAQLATWARKDRRGVVCDSSTGFVLPNGARRSPDASWTLKSRVQQMGDATKKGFVHLCPNFVIEIKSDTDRLSTLQKKMREYIEQGAELGWLINPAKRTVEIYRPNGASETLANVKKVAGEGPVTGFVLNLKYVWDPLAD
jgi:Uma2 family endonuclease